MSWFYSNKPSETDQLKERIEDVHEKVDDMEQTLLTKISALETLVETQRVEIDRLTANRVFFYYDGSMYQGGMTDEQVPHGYGTIVYSCGNRYVGNWNGGHFHGNGTLYIYDRPAFHGEWENGLVNGIGWYEGYAKNVFVNGVMVAPLVVPPTSDGF